MTTITTATPAAVLPKRAAVIPQIEAAGFNPRVKKDTAPWGLRP